MNAFRCLLVAVIALGMVVPAMPVTADACPEPRPAAPACDDAGAPADSCCPGETDRHDEGDEEDGDCCPSGCACICCGCAVVSAWHRSARAAVTVVPRSASTLVPNAVLSPQDFVGALLHPPQA